MALKALPIEPFHADGFAPTPPGPGAPASQAPAQTVRCQKR